MLRILILTMSLGGACVAQESRTPVDLELVLLADASGSIDPGEIALQRQGYATAMADEQVLWAIANGGGEGAIAVTYVEWASEGSQDVVVDWMIVAGAQDAATFADRLTNAPRRAFGSNAIGAALLKGLELIDTNAFEGSRKVIDFSADSMWNPQGPTIAEARDIIIGADVVINGLAVLCRECSGRPRGGDLEAEFTDQLIGGLGAFVITADGATSFARAVQRKLFLEIADLRP